MTPRCAAWFAYRAQADGGGVYGVDPSSACSCPYLFYRLPPLPAHPYRLPDPTPHTCLMPFCHPAADRATGTLPFYSMHFLHLYFQPHFTVTPFARAGACLKHPCLYLHNFRGCRATVPWRCPPYVPILPTTYSHSTLLSHVTFSPAPRGPWFGATPRRRAVPLSAHLPRPWHILFAHPQHRPPPSYNLRFRFGTFLTPERRTGGGHMQRMNAARG